MPRHATATSFGGESGNRRGKGPKPGAPNAGPPTKALKFFLSDLRHSAKAQAAIRAAAEDAKSPNFSTAWKLLTAYDDDKPAEKAEVKAELVIRIEREGRRITR